MSASLMLSNALIIFVNLLALGVMGLFVMDIYRQRKPLSAAILFFIVALLLSLINSATIQGNIDEIVDRINAAKCKPSAIKKAPYRTNPKLIL